MNDHDQYPKPAISFIETPLINICIYGGTCPCLWDSISINRHQPQLCAVKPLQVWQKSFPKHDIDVH